jgi:hypothetical protein
MPQISIRKTGRRIDIATVSGTETETVIAASAEIATSVKDETEKSVTVTGIARRGNVKIGTAREL